MIVNMKLLALCILLVASQVQATHPITGDYLDQLMTKALERFHHKMSMYNELSLPDPPHLLVAEKENYLFLLTQVFNPTVFNPTTLTLIKLNNNLTTQVSEIGMQIKNFNIKGFYDIQGSGNCIAASGNGTFEVKVYDMVVYARCQMKTVAGGTLQVDNLSLSYTIRDLQVRMDELSIDGMSGEQVQDYLRNSLLEKIQFNEPQFSQAIGRQLTLNSNLLLKGVTLGNIVAYLEKLAGEI